ncbi:hypothetical protein Goarm_014117 [Gossypium armourianum]|uniref:Uncharacterized protein n=1 Tax=Gossypium armourianum TaxID=34283 RepID=A0A7J9J5Y2_9ROSI|nr:hypothetical protein [Gossypium armourianum]
MKMQPLRMDHELLYWMLQVLFLLCNMLIIVPYVRKSTVLIQLGHQVVIWTIHQSSTRY